MTLVPNCADRCFEACLCWTGPFSLLIEKCTCNKLTASLFPLRDKTLGVSAITPVTLTEERADGSFAYLIMPLTNDSTGSPT